MMIFHSYVKLPEGISLGFSIVPPFDPGLGLELMLTVEENQQLRVVHLQHHSYPRDVGPLDPCVFSAQFFKKGRVIIPGIK